VVVVSICPGWTKIKSGHFTILASTVILVVKAAPKTFVGHASAVTAAVFSTAIDVEKLFAARVTAVCK
jgi:hypothetical protein